MEKILCEVSEFILGILSFSQSKNFNNKLNRDMTTNFAIYFIKLWLKNLNSIYK